MDPYLDAFCNFTMYDDFVDTSLSCTVGSDSYHSDSEYNRQETIYLEASAASTSL